jgi:diguanylate cyclase (GGDEF)-like protein/PAS domain S-box-containing protein
MKKFLSKFLKSKKIFNIKSLFISIIIIFLVVGTIYIYNTWKNYQLHTKDNAIKLAQSAAAFLPMDLVKKLDVNQSDIEKPEYNQLKNSLMLFKESNYGVNFAYIYTLIDKKAYFMADSEKPGTEGYSPPGQYYYEAASEMTDPFENGKNTLTGPITDRWGTWVSVLIPLFDPQTGKVFAILGVDYSAEAWSQEIIKQVLIAAFIVLCLLISIILIYWIIAKNIKLESLGNKLKDSEVLFRTTFEQAPIGIALVSNFNFTNSVNTMFEKILGRKKDDIVSIDWKEITHPEDLDKDLQLFKKFKSGKISGYSMEKRFIRPDGSGVWVNMLVKKLNLSDRENHIHLCIVQDINEKKNIIESLKESERSKSVLLSHLPGIAYRCKYDREWTMLFLSEGCYKLTGYKPEELVNNKSLSFNQLISPEYRDIIWEEWGHVIVSQKPFQFEYEIICASGERKWVWEMGQGIYDDNGNVEELEGIIIDITESKERFLQIQFMNEHDSLTGLYNRRYFEEKKQRLDKEEFLPLSILHLDINGVRLINDAFGYSKGDSIIIQTGKIIQSCCRNEDILARIGEDEFSILMPNTKPEKASEMLHKIDDSINKYNLSLKDQTQYISLAIGYGTKHKISESIKEAEKEAEEYMNKRKLLERKSYHHTILTSIMDTMYARSQETEQHAKRLAYISKLIGEKMKLSQKNMDELQLFAMLHDVGKIAIDDLILNKPGKLTNKERDIMKKHPEIGYRIAMATPELASVAEYILYHHERWDGKGYPAGLSGKNIPLLSRILSFADAYDAMTENRVYRKSLNREDAIEEIRKNVGKQFDPEIFDVFLEII